MDPRPDYVLVYSTDPEYNSPIRGLSGERASALRAKRAEQIRKEYHHLLKTLKQANIHATSRKGAEGTNTLLIFVKAEEHRVREEATRERMSDWLHGLASPRASPREPRDFAAEPVEMAERLRLVYAILTTPRILGTPSIRSPIATGHSCGLPLAEQLPPRPPNKVEFPHLIDLFPPHDPEFNRLWMKRWTEVPMERLKQNPLDALSIPQHELDELKAHMGEQVAVYFAFLGFYARWLAFPSLIGAFFWVLGLRYHPFLGLGFIGWSVLFVETWRIRERALAVQWGTYHLERVEQDRPGFVGDGYEVDPVTGVTRQRWSFGRTLTRGLASVPAYAAFVGFLGVIVAMIYVVETITNEVYDGHFQRILSLLPTVLFVAVVPQVNALWKMTADKLVVYENHPRSSEHDASLAMKTFALNFVSAYGNLLLTSYIPFGSFLVPWTLSRLPHAESLLQRAQQNGMFGVNPSKLHRQLIAYTLTNQITGAFLEVGLPYLKERFGPVAEKKLQEMPAVEEKLEKLHLASKKGDDEKDPELDDTQEEKNFLERIRHEQQLPTEDIFGEYAEMVTQFGYLTMFAVVWPISPLWSLINNIFEIRSDAFKIVTQTRRPIPSRTASVGPWLDILGLITYVGSLTTSSLIWMYQEREVAPGKMARAIQYVTHKNATIPTSGHSAFWSTRLGQAQSINLPPPSDAPQLMGALPPGTGTGDAMDAVKHLLITAFVVALLSSQGYMLMRGLARWLLTRLEWDDSIAHQLARRRELELKRAWLDENDLRMTPKEMTRRAMGWEKKSREDEDEENKDPAAGLYEGEVGKPSDAAAGVASMEDFWRRDDVGTELFRDDDKTA
ncbi:hypothetical protein JCM8202v2_003823 [Rhodotorula sphaerocarpa]